MKERISFGPTFSFGLTRWEVLKLQLNVVLFHWEGNVQQKEGE